MMLEERAIVTAVNGELAEVVTQRKHACDSCAVSSGCGTGIISRAFGERPLRLQVHNSIGAQVGDQVILGLEDRLLVRSSLLVYALPLVTMLAAGFWAESLAASLQWQQAELMTILIAMLGLLAGFGAVRYINRAIAADRRYQPQLLRRQLEQNSVSGPPPRHM